jgi:hypothetical protein
MIKEATGLGPEEVEQFRRDGYLVCHRQLFPPEKFGRLQATFERILANAPPGKKPEDLDVPHYAYPELFEWLLADEVLDVVEPLVGPNIALWSSHFIAKPRGDGKAVPWHTDGAYWRDLLDPMNVITLWLAVDESTRENGCMRVIPGTHRGGIREHGKAHRPGNLLSINQEVPVSPAEEARAGDLELRAGEISLHHGMLIHGSNPNRSTRRRCGLTLRYVSPAVRQVTRNSQGRTWAAVLVRGVDRYLHFDARPAPF